MKRLALAALLALSGCPEPEPESRCGPRTGVVANIVDGDTIDLEDGTRLRLLLVDAPEITSGKDDCYGQEAAAYTRLKLLGQEVSLAYDEAGCADRYGRTLAYVSVGELEVNRELVKRGLACDLHISPAGDDRAEEFEGYESVARNERTGMWGVCTDIPCSE